LQHVEAASQPSSAVFRLKSPDLLTGLGRNSFLKLS
jgi:hypothetical protein